MEKWYVMRTVPGKEQEAGALMEKTIDKKPVESVESFEKTEAVPGQREAALKYGDDVPRLYFCQKQFAKRTGGGIKQIQGISETDRK